MAKELPYFQFEPAEYLTKDVSFCSLSAQGLFSNICSYYWQRQCNLTQAQFLKRLNHPVEFNELLEQGVIDLDEDCIRIKFLDIQYYNATNFSKEQSRKGKLGGRPRKEKPSESQVKADAKPNVSHKIREDKIIVDNKLVDFLLFWDLYDKKTGKDKCQKKFISLSNEDVRLILDTVKIYIGLTPDVKYRKNPLSWLNGKNWLDENLTVSKVTNQTTIKSYGKTNQI